MKKIYIVRIFDEGPRAGEYEFWDRTLAEIMYNSAEVAEMYESTPQTGRTMEVVQSC
ncbi:MAG: hypothetical protein IKG00_01200 [Lachnospiraceae bacterium]|nr:hypothetical protein [Lachnospiraceae bacterium]MDO4530332.1 hypothetical protein [Lachnospiraceae bacterium]MDO4733760.1 hypothetical protein [Lachnospiraceae bacterium]